MIEETKALKAQELCDTIVEEMQNKKAENIVVIDLREVENAVTDFFVIASGNSTTQVDGIADGIVRFTRKKLREKPWHLEGKSLSQWILLDYVNVVVHVFHKEIRPFYELEDLWADGVKTMIEND